jgi:hypothetical protein
MPRRNAGRSLTPTGQPTDATTAIFNALQGPSGLGSRPPDLVEDQVIAGMPQSVQVLDRVRAGNRPAISDITFSAGSRRHY